MSFTEAQIRQIAADEIRRQFAAFLEVTKPKQPEPTQQPKPAQTPPVKQAFLSPRLDAVLNYEKDADGALWAKVKNHVSPDEFRAIAIEIEDLRGVKYEKGKGWRLPQQ